jgi:hypothetical protein
VVWRFTSLPKLFASRCACSDGRTLRAGKLSGEVAEASANAPLGKAFVLVHQPEGKKDFIVKVSNGRFELSLAPGRYDVFVSAEGFAPTCAAIRVTAGETASYKPRLVHSSD